MNEQNVLDELAMVAFGEASDISSSPMKYSTKLKALELLGKHFGLWEREDALSAEHLTVTFETEMEAWTQ